MPCYASGLLGGALAVCDLYRTAQQRAVYVFPSSSQACTLKVLPLAVFLSAFSSVSGLARRSTTIISMKTSKDVVGNIPCKKSAVLLRIRE